MTPEDIFQGFQQHETFCRESLKVQDKGGHIVPMVFGPAQAKLNAIVERQKARQKPIRIIALKARQVWVSVGTAAQFFHGTPFLTGQHTLVLANDEKTAVNLFQHYQRFQDNYKPFGIHPMMGGGIKLPAVIRNSSSEIEWANGSWIQAHTTGNLNIGRSFTLRRVHFSEAAFYQDLKSTMKGVMAAVPDDPDTMVVVESTANGVGNEFHRLWQNACDPASGSEWVPFFFAWWEHPEYSKPLEMPADRFQASLSPEEAAMMGTYTLTLEQLYWRRWTIANKLNGDKSQFQQEYPGNAEEAFLSSGRPRFSHQHLNRMPIIRDAVTGGLEEDLVGLERRIVFLPRDNGELTVFRRPEQGKLYMIGADVAEGIDASEGKGDADPDYSVAIVRDRDTGDQCATLRGRLTPSVFGAYWWLLMRWYNLAMIVPEANGPGLAAIDELLRQRCPPGLIYHRRGEPDEDPYKRVDRVGWKTTVITRPQLLSIYETAIREMSIYIRDPIVAQEARTFVIKTNGRAEGQKSCHDDCVIADALCVVGIQQMPRPVPQQGQAVRPEIRKYGQARGDERGERVRLR